MKKINLSFFILLVFFIQVILADNLIYFLNISYLVSNIISIIFNIMLMILLIKKKVIKVEFYFSKWDLFFLIGMILIICTTIIFPDEFWDSYSYHIYLQENAFADKINNDFFPGRTLTSFVFPLVDRIFYMFRSILGFRLGTLPGYLILIVMFYEIKKILKKLLKKEIKEVYLSILSILPLCTFVILQQIGTYYIDNFSIVILLEFVYIILTEADEILKNKASLYYLALMIGLSLGIKVTNIIYMIIPLIYILIKNFKFIKNIKWFDYILLPVVVIIPVLPYFMDAIVQTGSPVFPYYNKILKSEYFSETNWLDTRYGPKNWIQFILWPIYIIKHPEKAYEVGKTDFAFASGFIISIMYLLYILYKKIIKKEKINRTNIVYIMTLLYFYLVWEKFIIGYTRYAGIIPVLSTILIIKIFVNAIEKQKILTILFLATLLGSTAYQGCYQYIYYGSPYNYILALKDFPNAKQKIIDNINNIFKDRNYPKYDIDGVWGVIYDDSAVPLMLNVDDRQIHLEYGFKTGETGLAQKIYWDNVLNNEIYIPLYSFKLDGKLQYLDIYNFEIIEISDIISNVNFLQGDSTIYIIKVKYNKEKTNANKEIFEKLQKQINIEN